MGFSPADRPRADREAVESTIFGAASSARDYYLQVSGKAFTFEKTGLLGWFDASRLPDYWWGGLDTNDTDHDGWVNPHVQKWAEVIRFTVPQFNYRALDTNPLDGALRPDELGVLAVIPKTDRSAPIAAWSGGNPNPMPPVVDGVTISTIAEVYIGAPSNLGLVAHELGHLLANCRICTSISPRIPEGMLGSRSTIRSRRVTTA